MVEGVIKQIDKASGRVVVELDEGREVAFTVGEHTDISVMEAETAGDVDGTLDDIEVGYLVSLDISEGDAGCQCHGLSCIS